MAKIAAETVAEFARKMAGTKALDATSDKSTDGYITTTVESHPFKYQHKIDPKVGQVNIIITTILVIQSAHVNIHTHVAI